MTEHYFLDKGLLTFKESFFEVRNMLFNIFYGWGKSDKGLFYNFPSLIGTSELERLDYFNNFPHLANIVSSISPSEYDKLCSHNTSVERGHLRENPDLALKSSACFPVYVHFKDKVLEEEKKIITSGQCFRFEEYYSGLDRLHEFEMFEIVYLGDESGASNHIAKYKRMLSLFFRDVGIDVEASSGADPFYMDGKKAQFQKISKVKTEMLSSAGVALASLNLHLNFFGTRFNIKDKEGFPIYSSCVGMGMERVIHSLLEKNDSDFNAIKLILKSLPKTSDD